LTEKLNKDFDENSNFGVPSVLKPAKLNKAFPEKLIIAYLTKKFLAVYGSRNVIIVRFEVFMAVKISLQGFRVVTRCGLVGGRHYTAH
jgi:hypothetical protein